jgi:membrane protease YdiL (CAAX protease family)
MKKFIIALAILFLVYAVQHVWVNMFILFREFMNGYSIHISNLFFMVIVAPIWEETLFRHIPITIGKKYFPKVLVEIIIGSSIIFGWIHGDVTNIIVQGFIGLTLCFVYIKLGLRYAILSHAIWNLSCFINLVS